MQSVTSLTASWIFVAPLPSGFRLIEGKTSAWSVSAVQQLVADAFDLPIKMVTLEQASLYGRDNHRPVTVQSQGPSQFNSLSVSLLPHFKRWHIKGLLVLDCLHLYTYLIACTLRDATLKEYAEETNCTRICGKHKISHTHTNTHARAHRTPSTMPLLLLAASVWQIILTPEKTEEGEEKERLGVRQREVKRGEAVPCGITGGFEGSKWKREKGGGGVRIQGDITGKMA